MALRRICERRCRFCGILDVFDDGERLDGDREKRMRPADPARQVGLTVL